MKKKEQKEREARKEEKEKEKKKGKQEEKEKEKRKGEEKRGEGESEGRHIRLLFIQVKAQRTLATSTRPEFLRQTCGNKGSSRAPYPFPKSERRNPNLTQRGNRICHERRMDLAIPPS